MIRAVLSRINHALKFLMCRAMYGKDCPHINGVGESWREL